MLFELEINASVGMSGREKKTRTECVGARVEISRFLKLLASLRL